MKHPFTIRLLSSAAFVLILANNAFAAPLVPNSALPDNVRRNNGFEDQRPAVGGAPIIRDETVKAKRTGSTATFELRGIKLEGATVYSDEQLKPLYADKLNTKITLDDLN